MIDFPIAVAEKKVKKGIPKWPQVMPREIKLECFNKLKYSSYQPNRREGLEQKHITAQ